MCFFLAGCGRENFGYCEVRIGIVLIQIILDKFGRGFQLILLLWRDWFKERLRLQNSLNFNQDLRKYVFN